ncbi:DUF222 domain-containing protein [Corynebacterium hindlerae]|uniref:DUF222 domain-containing protein n=1 Tax=Corynebacterium hindlerae TaxID=699041 RepID=UPI001AD6E5BA|nr:DUF222 domain-containing protein [Corynebacterium hindlerae]QTH59964.1 DUF222 domain-containing protein [Corynebacterium hindlerae]
MNTLERAQGLLAGILSSQHELLHALGQPGFSAEQTRELLASVREVDRLADLLTTRLLSELQHSQGFEPNSRASFNKLMHEGRFSRKQLKDLSRLSTELFDSPPSVGHTDGIPARLPHTAAGMAKAAFGAESATVITKTLDAIPKGTPPDTVAWVEEVMASMAHQLAPDDLVRAGQKILQGLNADSEPSDEERQHKRSVKLSAQDSELMGKLAGTVTPELHALLSRLFADYAGPGDLLPEGEKENDSRTQDQRNHDALVKALKYALSGPMRPTRGCSTVVATMTIEQLATAAGVVPTDVGTLLSVQDLIRLGADKNAFLAILDPDTGNLIELGKTSRAANLYAYLGLVASQGGDMTPGSSLPAALCEIHHLLAWRFSGRSTAGNMSLIGHNTHRNVDDAQENPKKWWTLCSETGQMLWIPPESIDPKRRPQANFNPMTWFNPGQMIRFGLHDSGPVPPFQRPRSVTCPRCNYPAA